MKALLEEPNWESFPSYAELPTHLGVDGWAFPRDPEHTQRLEWWGMGGTSPPCLLEVVPSDSRRVFL